MLWPKDVIDFNKTWQPAAAITYGATRWANGWRDQNNLEVSSRGGQDASPSTDWKKNPPSGRDGALQFVMANSLPIQGASRSKRVEPRHCIATIDRSRRPLEVLPALPDFARHGLFAARTAHEVWVRPSNGGMNRAPDAVPDIRGFALGYSVCRANRALGNGPLSQDFT